MLEKDFIIKRAEPRPIPPPTPPRKIRPNRFLLPVVILAFLIALGTAGYFYWQWHLAKTNPTELSEKETRLLVEKVGKLIILPLDEEPTIATVSDPNILKDQPFFARANVGDKVLIYSKAKKAILYNPSSNKIVEVAPINFDNNNASTTLSDI